MEYPYTVILQSKNGHKPLRFKTKAPDITTLIQRLKRTELHGYKIKSLIRRSANATQ
jgi:hypothetical protein